MPVEAGGSVITFSRSKPHSSTSLTSQEQCLSNPPANTADQMSVEASDVENSSTNDADGIYGPSLLHIIYTHKLRSFWSLFQIKYSYYLFYDNAPFRFCHF